MKILHTSDWHVGRTIRGRSRADEHREVLAEIARIADERDVDLVLVPGDLFDRAAPPPEAEQIVYRALLDLVDAGAHVVLVAGNHDNWRRLRAVEPLLGLARVDTCATLSRPDEGGVVTVEAGGEAAAIALLPWLSQRSIVKADELMQLDPDEHANEYAARSRLVIERLCAALPDDSIQLVASHLMVQGGRTGGGERRAHTVFDYCVSAHAFPESLHYVALGHLHRAQQIPGRCPVWYSGSPLQLDFGEEAQDKFVLLIEASPSTPAKVERVRLEGGKRLRTITGTLEALEASADDVTDDHLRVVVEGPRRAGLADEVRDLFPSAVDVVLADPDRDGLDAQEFDLDRMHGSPSELFAAYLGEQGVRDERVRELFADLLEEHYASDTA